MKDKKDLSKKIYNSNAVFLTTTFKGNFYYVVEKNEDDDIIDDDNALSSYFDTPPNLCEEVLAKVKELKNISLFEKVVSITIKNGKNKQCGLSTSQESKPSTSTENKFEEESSSITNKLNDMEIKQLNENEEESEDDISSSSEEEEEKKTIVPKIKKTKYNK